MKYPHKTNAHTGECALTEMSKEPDITPNAQGSWGVGMYSTAETFTGECDSYGFWRPKNPNHFFPDYECCEPFQIANHTLACALFDQGKWKDLFDQGEWENL